MHSASSQSTESPERVARFCADRRLGGPPKPRGREPVERLARGRERGIRPLGSEPLAGDARRLDLERRAELLQGDDRVTIEGRDAHSAVGQGDRETLGDEPLERSPHRVA